MVGHGDIPRMAGVGDRKPAGGVDGAEEGFPDRLPASRAQQIRVHHGIHLVLTTTVENNVAYDIMSSCESCGYDAYEMKA